MFGRMILGSSSGAVLLLVVLSSLRQLVSPTAPATYGIAGLFFAMTGFVGVYAAGRGVVRTGERFAVIAMNGVTASCLGLGALLAVFGAAGNDTPVAVFSMVWLFVVMLLPMINIAAVASVPVVGMGDEDEHDPKPSRLGTVLATVIGGVVLALVLFVCAVRFAVAAN